MSFEEINSYLMIKINLDNLRNDFNRADNNSCDILSNNDLVIYNKIFIAIFKVLRSNNFWKPEDGVTSKTRYLNNIQHFVSNYSISNKCTSEEKKLINVNKLISQNILDSLIEMKLIKINKNIIEFNQFEMLNLHSCSPDIQIGKNIIIETNFILIEL